MQYITVTPTLCDSTIAEGQCWSVFFAIAHTDDPGTFFESIPDSGYSVDNLAPSVPESFRYESPALLAWEASPETDFNYFTVYGSAVHYLDESADLIGHTTGTSLDITGNDYLYYHLTATDFAGNEGEAASLSGSQDVSDPDFVPASFALYVNRPNPGRPSTAIIFDLPEACPVKLVVFDVSGRHVARLAYGQHRAGRHVVAWDGRSSGSEDVETGVYFYRLEAGEFTQTKKMLIAR